MEALKTLLVLSCPYSLSLVELNSEEKTLLIVIYNNQNQRRYIGVKLN